MTLRQYEKNDCQQVVDLLNRCFEGKKITSNSFNWKHFDYYFNSKTISYLAEENNIIVSFVCFVPAIVCSNDIKHQFFSCAIQATDPQHRRKGLVSKLTKEIEKQLGDSTNYFGFSNQSGVNIDLHSKHIQYDIVGQMATSYLPALPMKKFKTRIVAIIPTKFLQVNQTPFLEIQKNNEFISWRYERHPKQHFIYVEVIDNLEIIGYVIARDVGLKYDIYDIFAKRNVELFQQILKSFSFFAFQHGKVIFSVTYLSNNFWKDIIVLPQVTRKTGIYFTLKSKQISHDIQKWNIQGGDIL